MTQPEPGNTMQHVATCCNMLQHVVRWATITMVRCVCRMQADWCLPCVRSHARPVCHAVCAMLCPVIRDLPSSGSKTTSTGASVSSQPAATPSAASAQAFPALVTVAAAAVSIAVMLL